MSNMSVLNYTAELLILTSATFIDFSWNTEQTVKMEANWNYLEEREKAVTFSWWHPAMHLVSFPCNEMLTYSISFLSALEDNGGEQNYVDASKSI